MSHQVVVKEREYFFRLLQVPSKIGSSLITEMRQDTAQTIYFLENLDLEKLAADRVYELAFVFAPLRLKGATGSPGNPIAVR